MDQIIWERADLHTTIKPYKDKSNEIIHKEIELIQNCIKKYDNRSLLIKGWSAALISLICGLTTSDPSPSKFCMVKDYIEQKPGILGGKAVIKGTRIGVDLILEKIGAGEAFKELLKAYPFLGKEALLACVSYGAASVRNETLVDVEWFSINYCR